MMKNSQSAKSDNNLSNIIKINEVQIQNHLSQMVLSIVKETLNVMWDYEVNKSLDEWKWIHIIKHMMNKTLIEFCSLACAATGPDLCAAYSVSPNGRLVRFEINLTKT